MSRAGLQQQQQAQQREQSAQPPPIRVQGCVRIGGTAVQLEQLTDEEDIKRRTSFCNWLIDSPRPEFKAYGVLLIDQPSKLAALIRVPRAIMTVQVLPSADAVQRMEDICAQCLGSSSSSSGAGAGKGADSSNVADTSYGPAGQQLLPEHAAELEAALPPGVLPSNWRALSFRYSGLVTAGCRSTVICSFVCLQLVPLLKTGCCLGCAVWQSDFSTQPATAAQQRGNACVQTARHPAAAVPAVSILVWCCHVQACHKVYQAPTSCAAILTTHLYIIQKQGLQQQLG
jgi:hypothetical protein